MLQLAAIDHSEISLYRRVENWGARQLCSIDYALGLDDWRKKRALMYAPRKWSGGLTGPWLAIHVDSATGQLQHLELTLQEFSIPDREPPQPTSRTEGIPQFDCTLWPMGECNVSEEHELEVGWIASDDLSLLVNRQAEKIAMECVVDATLSLLFSENRVFVGLIMRSFARLDKLIMKQTDVTESILPS